MTRKEITNCRDLTFSNWIREHLPDSADGFMVTDLDFILSNYKTKTMMLLEVKTRGCPVRKWQRNIFLNLHRWITKGIDDDWTYLGFHKVTFEKTNFQDGYVYFDSKQVSTKELIKLLSF